MSDRGAGLLPVLGVGGVAAVEVVDVKPEESLQSTVADWLDLMSDRMDFVWFHVPGGGHMSVAMGRKRKRLGAKAGVPDIFVHYRGGLAMQIELKTEKGRLSKSQKEWQSRCEDLQIPHHVCRNLAQVQIWVNRYHRTSAGIPE